MVNAPSAAALSPKLHRALPVVSTAFDTEQLIGELQARGMRLALAEGAGLSRIGGAGPSDHKAVRVGGQVLMVPVFTSSATDSPFELRQKSTELPAQLFHAGQFVANVEFPRQPRFYRQNTADGVPYWKIATLHGEDVLATTVLQNCIRYADRATSCQFCAIGKSLHARSTIPRKTPSQLAEVARTAVELDSVKHMVMTTGTPPTEDRGAALLCESAAAVKAAIAHVGELPIQGQCEPPDDFQWFDRLRAAGVDSLGLHLEAVTEPVRQRIMPGKAEIPVSRYLEAFSAAVRVFGRGQVSTYILAGLGDPADEIVAMAERVAQLGVYPFVVPFVPIAGTPLAGTLPPDPAFMGPLLDRVAAAIAAAELSANDVKAGCAKCGACSTLKARERSTRASTRGAIAGGE